MVKRKGDIVRPTSVVFKAHSDDQGISVDVRRLLPDSGDPLSVLADLPNHGLVELRAGVPRVLGLTVDADALPENPAHANINGMGGLEKPEAKRLARELALASVWIRQPSVARAA